MSQKVYVDLYHRQAVLLGNYPDKVKEILRYRVNNYHHIIRHQPLVWKVGDDGEKSLQPRWDGWKSLVNRDRIGSGLFKAVRRKLEKKCHIRFVVNDIRHRLKFNDDDMKSDRYYQNDCVEEMLPQKTGGLILNATGSGKTKIVGIYLRRLVGTAVFVVDELTLLKQARKALGKILEENVGIVGMSKFKPRRVTVATIQTLDKHRKNPKFLSWSQNLDVMFLDEVHLALGSRYLRTIQSMKPRVVFGLTATLAIEKKEILWRAQALCGKVIYEYKLERGQQDKVLARVCVLSIQHRDGETRKRKWHSSLSRLVIRAIKRNTLVAELAKELHSRGKHILVFVERLEHLDTLHEMLRDIRHRRAFGKKSASHRKQTIKDLQSGKIRLILANKVFLKGVDIPRIDAIIDAAAGKDKNNALQKLGRGTRIYEGKKGLLYFDISDRHKEKGLHSGDNGFNRFSSATGSRLMAFKRSSIPVVSIDPKEFEKSTRYEEIVDIAEKKLKEEIKKHA